MATIQGQINTPRDTTIQATNTALGLLGKDASLQDIKTALLAIVAAITPSIENDYDELTNKPQVNGVTLSGNKTSKQLGIRQTIPMNSAAYAQLTSAEKMDPDKDYIITDINATSAPIDDNNTSNNKVWSSAKTDNTKADKEAILQTVEECSASTNPDDIAGAAALSSLNSALTNMGKYSTTEEVIGTWIDGKPLYRKTVYSASLGSGMKVPIAHGISNLGVVVGVDAVCFDSMENAWFPLSHISTDGYNIGIFSVDGTNINFSNPVEFGSRIIYVYATIKYTKTTD